MTDDRCSGTFRSNWTCVCHTMNQQAFNGQTIKKTNIHLLAISSRIAAGWLLPHQWFMQFFSHFHPITSHVPPHVQTSMKNNHCPVLWMKIITTGSEWPSSQWCTKRNDETQHWIDDAWTSPLGSSCTNTQSPGSIVHWPDTWELCIRPHRCGATLEDCASTDEKILNAAMIRVGWKAHQCKRYHAYFWYTCVTWVVKNNVNNSEQLKQ